MSTCKKTIRKTHSAWFWLCLSLFIIALDQITKHLILRYISVQQIVHVFPFLNFVLRFNAGAAFSFLNYAGGWQVLILSGIALIASVALIVWLTRLKQSDWLMALPLSLILGGAVGNLIDRVRFSYVIDFVDFHIGTWHFATFNVADVAVSVGATWLILRLICESFTRKS